MAKKKETKKVEVEIPQVQEMVIEEPVVETPKVEVKSQIKEKSKPANDWEIKDRVYYLTKGRKPLSYIIKSADLYWFDDEKGYEREIKYCQNQKT